MERRITLNDNTMEKKNENNSFENVSNEKQNSPTSGIRINFGGNFPIIKQKFVKIKEAEYSTDFEFFIQNQIHVVVNSNRDCTICSSVEKRVFWQGSALSDDAVYNLIETVHNDIISFCYGGELVY